MPIFKRTSRISCSVRPETSVPSTTMEPESGLSSPRTMRRIVVLPDPEPPRTILVVPGLRLKVTPFRMGRS